MTFLEESVNLLRGKVNTTKAKEKFDECFKIAKENYDALVKLYNHPESRKRERDPITGKVNIQLDGVLYQAEVDEHYRRFSVAVTKIDCLLKYGIENKKISDEDKKRNIKTKCKKEILTDYDHEKLLYHNLFINQGDLTKDQMADLERLKTTYIPAIKVLYHNLVDGYNKEMENARVLNAVSRIRNAPRPPPLPVSVVLSGGVEAAFVEKSKMSDSTTEKTSFRTKRFSPSSSISAGMKRTQLGTGTRGI